MDMQKVKNMVPGTESYEQTHGLDQVVAATNQIKSYIPGTEAHQKASAGDPGYQITDPSNHHHAPGAGLGLPGMHQAKEHIPGTIEHAAKKDRE